MDTFRWSVRHMQRDALEKLLEISKNNEGEALGVLASEAIIYWYENACEEEDEESIVPTEAADIQLLDVGQSITHLRNNVASHSLGQKI